MTFSSACSADRLRVSAEQIAIVSGDESRIKQLRIETLAQAGSTRACAA